MSSRDAEPRDADGPPGERPAGEDAQLDDLDAHDNHAAEVKGGPTGTTWQQA